ncbi:MAG: VTT domain-containing protein [Hyphomonadaceae bacterium]
MTYPWGIYVLVALGPFVQEDAAILSAAAASVAGLGTVRGIFLSLIVGLSISDLWKYWLGRAAHTYEWGRKAALKPGVQAAKSQVIEKLGVSLIIARFVPGTRIPLYLACGFFRAPFWKVALFVVSSAILYVVIAFSLFHWLGDMAGHHIERFAPIVGAVLASLVVGYLILTWRRSKAANQDEV